jgi:Rrf2 family protein
MIYSNACEYAIRGMAYLARQPLHQLCLLNDIAASESLPYHFMGKIFQHLVRAGLMRSVKGPGGGFGLTRAPDAISLYQIKEAIDGTDDLYRCAVGLNRCEDSTPCPLHDTFKPLRLEIRTYLEQTTLSDMASAVQQKKSMNPPATLRRKAKSN